LKRFSFEAESLKARTQLLIGLAMTLCAAQLGAHHSPAAYDLQQDLLVDGVVTRVHWANPHVYVYLEAEAEDGTLVEWQIEVDAPSNMERHGWYRDTLLPGDEGRARMFPGRDESKRIAKLYRFRKADGTHLSWFDPAFLDADAETGQTADSLAGIWAPDPLDSNSAVGRLQEQLILASYGQETNLPLTAKGLEAVRSFSDEISPTVQCIPRTAPSITMYTSGLHAIEIQDDVVILRENWFGTERIARLDVESHDGAPYEIQGHSIAHWEGDVLVVDSANFTEHREGLFNKLPSGRGKRLIERFELNADGQSLTYQWEVMDPEYLTVPVSGENRWAYRPDAGFSIVECSLESARQFLED
jgi:hypothetical protein